MSTGNAVKRRPSNPATQPTPAPKIPDHVPVLDYRAPGRSAALFEAAHYAGRALEYTLKEFTARSLEPHFTKMRFAVNTDILRAQVWRFLERAVDRHGNPFEPTPARVRAVLYALSARCQTGLRTT